MSAKRSDSALPDECDWSFMERPEVTEVIERLAHGSLYRAGGLDPEDVRQELCLFLGVRPEVQRKPLDLLSLDLYALARELEKTAARRAAREVALIEEVDSFE